MVRLVRLATVGLAGMLSTCAAAAMDEKSENRLQGVYSVVEENVTERIALPREEYLREKIGRVYNNGS